MTLPDTLNPSLPVWIGIVADAVANATVARMGDAFNHTVHLRRLNVSFTFTVLTIFIANSNSNFNLFRSGIARMLAPPLGPLHRALLPLDGMKLSDF
jgi:hypothetical protein